MDKIIIEKKDYGFNVIQGQKYADHLTWDELLGVVAALTMPEDRPHSKWMKTKEQHEDWYNSLSPKLPELEPWQKLIEKQ